MLAFTIKVFSEDISSRTIHTWVISDHWVDDLIQGREFNCQEDEETMAKPNDQMGRKGNQQDISEEERTTESNDLVCSKKARD